MSNGRDFGASDGRAAKAAKAAADSPKTRITQQFRERHNMTYELECAGTPLVLRMFPAEGETEAWRVEARRSDQPDAVVAIASAPTREQALREIEAFGRDQPASGLSALDWEAVIKALVSVKAI